MNRLNKLLFCGILIFLFILYNRLLRHREPRFLVDNLYNLRLFLYMFTCVLMLALCILKLYNSYYPKEPSSLFKMFLNIWSNTKNPVFFWKNSLLELDMFIKNNLPMYDGHINYAELILEKISQFFIKYTTISLLTIYGLKIICKTIVIIALFYDIFILEKFQYFFKVLWLLIVPMAISYIIHSIRTSAEVNIQSLDNVLDFSITSKEQLLDEQETRYTSLTIEEWYIVVTDKKGVNYVCRNTLKPTFLSEHPDVDPQYVLNYCVDCLNLFFGVRVFLENYDLYTIKWFSIYDVLLYFTYTICWTRIVYVTLIYLHYI